MVLGLERRIPGAGGQQVVDAHLHRLYDIGTNCNLRYGPSLINFGDGSQFLRELVALVDVHARWLRCDWRLLGHVAESERLGILAEALAALAVENVLEPLLEVLLGEGGLHDRKDPALGVDEEH